MMDNKGCIFICVEKGTLCLTHFTSWCSYKLILQLLIPYEFFDYVTMPSFCNDGVSNGQERVTISWSINVSGFGDGKHSIWSRQEMNTIFILSIFWTCVHSKNIKWIKQLNLNHLIFLLQLNSRSPAYGVTSPAGRSHSEWQIWADPWWQDCRRCCRGTQFAPLPGFSRFRFFFGRQAA